MPQPDHIPDPEHDPDNPPPGCTQGVCVACAGTGEVQMPRTALGPIPGTDLAPDQLGTLLGWGKCRVCRGRGWVWISAPEET